jgi:hypothetical protein
MPHTKSTLSAIRRYSARTMAAMVMALATTVGVAQTAQQTPGTALPQPGEEEPTVSYGGYQVQQSIEFGGRISDVTGSNSMFNTFINQHSGPRLFEQTLSMQSINHTGTLFDSLNLSSFGWGGDANNVLRLNLSKNKWYNFDGSFRRDQYFFDYDLLANPLNPPTSNPSVPITFSPHSYNLSHRMYDYSLTLLPQSKVRFRLEYTRNREEGPSFSSLHVGTEALLNQPWNTTANRYHFGVDFRVLPKTDISYDQYFKYFKGDTDYSLAAFGGYPLANGATDYFGVSWDTAGNSPCRTPIVGGLANPACSGYLSYTRTQRQRTYIPTERLSLNSRAIHNLELTGVFQYSSADMHNPMADSFNGLESRTGGIVENTTATADHGTWTSVVTELGATYRVTERLRLLDTFRFYNWRIPAFVQLNELTLFNATTAATPSILLPTATFPPPVKHSTSSPADLILASYASLLGEDDKSNEIRMEYDFTRRVGASIGYRYLRRYMHHMDSTTLAETFYPTLPNRGDCAGLPLNPDGSCSTTTNDSGDDVFPINQHTGLIALWARPTDALRINFDASFTSADNFITRISPTGQQQYRARISYTPRPWATLGANLDVLQNSNHADIINYDGHVRDYGFNAMLAPNDRFTLNLSYDYYDYQQNANVCYIGGGPTGAPACPLGPGLLEAFGNYNDHTNFGMVLFSFKPVKRVHASLGYSGMGVDGSTLILNPLQPTGTLSYIYHQPLASLGVELAKRWTWNLGWNYDQYNENGAVGPTASRYFHDNRTTLSLRYAF